MALIHLTGSMHNQPELKPSMLMLEHRGRALREMLSILEHDNVQLSEALLIAIVLLATIDSSFGDIESLKFHTAALKMLSRERGYLKISPDHCLRDLVSMYGDVTFALKTGKSAFDRRSYEAVYLSHPLPPDVELPEGFKALISQIPISQDAICVLVNACRLGLSAPCVTLKRSQNMYLASRRQRAKKYFNYLDSVPILFVPDSPDVLFEKSLVLALSLFAWCGFNTVRSPQFGMYNAMIVQLFNRLVQIKTATKPERDCAAWMWLMAIDACRLGGSNGTILLLGHEILWQFHQKFPEYQSWACLQVLTRLFFWTGDMENFWARNWETLSSQTCEHRALP